MTQSRIKGGEMRQNGSQCGGTGVKHDQTAVLNGGYYRAKNVSGRWRQKETGVALLPYLVTHAPTTLALCPARYECSISLRRERLLVAKKEQKKKSSLYNKSKLFENCLSRFTVVFWSRGVTLKGQFNP